MTEPHYIDDCVTLFHGDCRAVLAEMEPNSVDCVVTDPPYDLTNRTPDVKGCAACGRTLGGSDGNPEVCPRCGGELSRQRSVQRKGFMNQNWDGTGVAFDPVTWEAVLRVLKPGGFLVAFGGTRTQHRMVCAIEDAGFEIRDSVSILWATGVGFPKSLSVSKAIDKLMGAEREVVGTAVHADGHVQRSSESIGYGGSDPVADHRQVTAPATPEAERWAGFGTALKPAYEPLILARKPLTAVPLWWEDVISIHHRISGLMCLLLSPAKLAELCSPSSHHESEEGCVSALVSAAASNMGPSTAKSDVTDTFRSPVAASTFWNIACSWNGILGALSDQMNTSTTSTEFGTTTACRILNSLLPANISPNTMPACECLPGGQASHVTAAAPGSSDFWSSWLLTLSASVPETAIEPTALSVCATLACIAEELLSVRAVEPTVGGTATSNTDGNNAPSVEPVVLARKPLDGTVAQNVLTHGTGALNIDGCRVAGPVPSVPQPVFGVNDSGVTDFGSGVGRNGEMSTSTGRWPANLLLVHNPDCVLSGTKTFRGNVAVNRNRDAVRGPNAPYVPAVNTTEDQGYVDEDGNETTAAWVCTEGCPAALIDRQSGDRPSAGGAAFSRNPVLQGGLDRTQADGRQIGFGDKGGASRFFSQFGWDHDDMVPVMYSAKAPSKERPFYMNEAGDRVAHPTVKPLSIMRWVTKLVTPPGGVVLDPFAGSGSTIEAALLEGFNAVGVEMTDEYLPLIEQRINRAYTSIESTPEPDPTLF